MQNTKCKIGFVGAKEVGKTGLSCSLNGYLKSIGESADLVHEQVRNVPTLLNERTNHNTSYWTLHTQIAAEALVYERRKFIICDRTVIDVLVFARCTWACEDSPGYSANKAHYEYLREAAISYLTIRPYDCLFYIPILKELWPIFGEPENPEFQRRVDNETMKILRELNVDFITMEETFTKGRVIEVMTHLRKANDFRFEMS